MRITDLLDIRSIALDAAPKSKQETLDAAVALMVKKRKDHRRRCVPRTGLRKRRREHHRNRRGNCDSARKM